MTFTERELSVTVQGPLKGWKKLERAGKPTAFGILAARSPDEPSAGLSAAG